MIGDTPYDAEAALGAGASAAGLLPGGFAREALAEAGCFVLARDLQDLLACLENGLRLALRFWSRARAAPRRGDRIKCAGRVRAGLPNMMSIQSGTLGPADD